MKNVKINEVIKELSNNELLDLYKKIDEHLIFLNNSIIKEEESDEKKDEK